MNSFDYIVVGAGPAGSVMASRLSEINLTSACLLEAGAPDKSPMISLPAGMGYVSCCMDKGSKVIRCGCCQYAVLMPKLK